MGERETVSGMADAIERRRLELGLTPNAFAEAAGVTTEGLRPLRKGIRKRYQDSVKIGVARALGWQPDAIDRLLRGEEPLELDAAGPSVPEIEKLRLLIEDLTEEVSLLRERLGASPGPRPEDP